MAQTAIEAATRRLSLALDALEAAVGRRVEAQGVQASAAAQLHVLDSDRARLAAELDIETARAKRLEAANREIAQRLDAAMDNIRAVLDGR